MSDDGIHVGGKRIYLIEYDKVVIKPVAWLWPSRIPLGKIAILDGDPGLGKGCVTLWIAAAVSTGRAWPDGGPTREPMNVLLLSSEDDPDDTIAARLEAAGADRKRIKGIDDLDDFDERGKRPMTFPDDFDGLRDVIIKREIRLTIIDPIMAFLSATVDSSRDQDVRRVLHQLKNIAAETGCAVLLVRHFNKNSGAAAIHRGGGSIGIIGAARVGMLIAEHPERPADRRVLAVTKINIAKMPPALTFELVPSQFNPAIPLVIWHGAEALSANDLLSPAKREEARKRETAVGFLRDMLGDGALHPQGEIFAAGENAGITKSSIKLAKLELGVKSKKVGFGASGYWCWQLPDAILSESPADTGDSLSDASDEEELGESPVE